MYILNRIFTTSVTEHLSEYGGSICIETDIFFETVSFFK